jgi:pimeloyl-ACP methyl ester carboxylesterase
MENSTLQTVLSKDGTHIAFDKIGAGPALILVNGALQYRSTDPRTEQLTKLLSEHFTVFNYDRRGRGDSGDAAQYAKEREVEDIEALIKEAGGSAAVFGMSSGAVLALEAAKQGLPIPKLALYEPPFIIDNGRPPVPADYLAHLKELLAADRRGDMVEQFMIQAVGVPAEYVAPMRNQPFWPGLESVAPTLIYDATVMGDTMSGNPATLQKWSSVSIPTLVIDGGDSPLFMHNAAQALVHTLPHAQQRTLDGQTHEVDPAVLAPALVEFLQQ